MKVVYQFIEKSLNNGEVSVSAIAELLGMSEETVLKKISGNDCFDINEAMLINKSLFPKVPFEVLFGRNS